MLHLRVVCPADQTEDVLRVLREVPGATHLVLLRGAALDPEGDVVEAEVAREATDEVLTELCRLGVDHSGGITLESIDTALSDAADRAEEAAPGEGADAVVWEELISRTGEESRLNATFQAFLTIACLLAAVGAVTDSAVTVVGAMVVGPEFGPLAAVAVGLVGRRWDLVRRAVVALLLGFLVATGITAGATLLAEGVGLFGPGVLDRGAAQVDFVFQVGPFSLIVAMLAGAAGMLAMTSAKSAALVGVFISVTTVPAAGFAAVAAVLGRWDLCARSFAQLAVNMVGIVLAAWLVLVLRRRGARNTRQGDNGRPLAAG
ncbi:putative hydrophobic domain-containing protein [Streptoalloteichus tenebrarius]|uniref:Hydrophobic domain-containing protein n=1 Tax=Streptoalloteichus tenebrarius (strain ATCC 17920 / DSM 40477 / JCM 4838 / CBS 697.72 / NBRC 16177 / NCIMB 11028 / NRRL B-12390 / A12253. 1 / ISP 5477) TaxID=1933 RepID=A0ABT1HSA7_STRSD|nr:DUF389 domain-containing protein [Streptoalloteichus tenebrarius]MCP2258404.1 putative hydrophobic domain-containing protein [Streptoalloteichus tenebrarius]BFF03574.1 DUF389 domain-containing protein [Streptoalloteichus tenebrarius]